MSVIWGTTGLGLLWLLMGLKMWVVTATRLRII
jgi:hypothetical protein